MRDIDIPNGSEPSLHEADIGDLVPGTMKQQRLLAPARVGQCGRHRRIFARSIQNW